VLERTSFRIRILTKNAIVSSERWINFFRQAKDRFVVGLSIGTVDDAWAKRVEIGTSRPSARLQALRNLQEAGIPTYGMLCPVFPDVLEGDALLDQHGLVADAAGRNADVRGGQLDDRVANRPFHFLEQRSDVVVRTRLEQPCLFRLRSSPMGTCRQGTFRAIHVGD